MNLAVKKEYDMERKIISISSKRQITIPQKYFEKLGFQGEAECILGENGIILRPITVQSSEFAEEILADLIAEGYSGEKLLVEFQRRTREIRPAVERLIEEADKIAKDGTSLSFEEVFGEDE